MSSGRRQKITWHNPPRRAKQITNPQHGPALSAFARGYCCVVVGGGVLAAGGVAVFGAGTFLAGASVGTSD
jgi:hypothetical protein